MAAPAKGLLRLAPIEIMVQPLQKLWRRGEIMGLIAAFAVALGVFYFVASVVRNLIAPAISVFIGESPFELNAL